MLFLFKVSGVIYAPQPSGLELIYKVDSSIYSDSVSVIFFIPCPSFNVLLKTDTDVIYRHVFNLWFFQYFTQSSDLYEQKFSKMDLNLPTCYNLKV